MLTLSTLFFFLFPNSTFFQTRKITDRVINNILGQPFEDSNKRTPDKSNSDVIKRVNGASINDGGFDVIRGLNDLYNASFINGASLSSTKSKIKAFAESYLQITTSPNF
jgi:hypothetical protein